MIPHAVFPRRRGAMLLLAAHLAGAAPAAGETVTADFTAPGVVAVTASGYSAAGHEVLPVLGFHPATGTELLVVENSGLDFIQGKFTNLAQGQRIELAHDGISYSFVADYFGGSGNDLVLRWGRQELAGWGNSDSGELGFVDPYRDHPVPLRVDVHPLLRGHTFTKVAAGGGTNYVLRGDGRIISFGRGWNGKLGNGSVTTSSSPVEVDLTGVLAGKEIVDVAAGSHACFAVTSDGTLAGWGFNGSGLLGDGSLTDSAVPVAVDTTGALSGKTVVAVSVGYEHVLALCSDGTLASWGRNTSGQLGDGSTEDSLVPVSIPMVGGVLAGKTVIAVRAGDSHSLALCSDGSIAAWGSNALGQLGDGSDVAFTSTPVSVDATGVLAGKIVKSIHSRGSFSLAWCDDGTLVAWGSNASGSLGDESTEDRFTPVLVKRDGSLAGKTLERVEAGFSSSFAVCTDGTIVGWGNNYGSVLGSTDISDSAEALPLPDLGALRGKVAARLFPSGAHVLAAAAVPFSADTSFSSFGLSAGVLDFGAQSARTQFHWSVPAGTASVRLTPVLTHPMATLKLNGAALASGASSPDIPLAGGGGTITLEVTAEDGSTTVVTLSVSTSAPVDAVLTSPDIPAASFPSLAAGGSAVTLALDFSPAPGTELTVAEITGLNFIHGEFTNLADGQVVTLKHDGISYRFVADYHGGDGNDLVLRMLPLGLAAWGNNSLYQLGNGSRTASAIPLAIPSVGALAGRTVKSVSTGDSFILALCTDGTLVGWGRNRGGPLGTGNGTSAISPVESQAGHLSGRRVVSVDAGDDYALAVCADGTVAGWGGDYGLLPMEITTSGALAGKSVVAVSAGWAHALALCSDGTVVEWANTSRIPVAVSTDGVLAGKTVVAISAGNDFSLALCADGTVAGWGTNSEGQLGNATPADATNPIRIDLPGQPITAIATGDHFSLALRADGKVLAWGRNAAGQLGNPAATGLPGMVDDSGVLAGKIVTAISAGPTNAFALCADGTVAAWGGAFLGTNTASTSGIPVEISNSGALAGRRTLAVSAGRTNVVAVTALQPSRDLAALAVAGGTLTPAFSPEITRYVVHVPAAPAALSITATTADAARLRIDAARASSGEPFPISRPAGSGTILVRVGPEDGETKDYELNTVVAAALPLPLSAAAEPWLTGTGFNFSGLPVEFSLGFQPEMGVGLRVVENTSRHFIGAPFANLPQGREVILTHGGRAYRYVANYHGGSGNDLVLEWANRSVLAWGDGTTGQLGNGGMTSVPLPVTVNPSGFLAGRTVLAVSSGSTNSVALCADGSVAVWGGGTEGQLGAGAITQSAVPISIDTSGVLAGKTVIAIRSSARNNLALCSDGTLVTWGDGNLGQLGNGSSVDAPSPVGVDQSGVLAGKSVIDISVGAFHALALCADGTVVSWGYNSFGQLGNGTKVAANRPVLVDQTGALAGKTVVQVCAGFQHSFAVCSDGSVIGWGDNSKGQLREGSLSYSAPRLVSFTYSYVGTEIAFLSQGAHSAAIALRPDGTAITWGNAESGQLGGLSGTGPMPGVLAGKTIVHLGSGMSHTIASCSDGTAVAWGANSHGQLGIGTATTSSGTPVLVSTAGPLAGKRALFASGATHSLLVAAAPDNGFATWISRFPNLSDTTPQGDADRDGVSNLMEFVLHGNPLVPSPAILPTATAAAGDFVFRFTRSTEAAAVTTQRFETSTNLSDWTPLPMDSPGVTLGTPRNDGSQQVTVTLPRNGQSRIFGRLVSSLP